MLIIHIVGGLITFCLLWNTAVTPGLVFLFITYPFLAIQRSAVYLVGQDCALSLLLLSWNVFQRSLSGCSANQALECTTRYALCSHP